jgi:putative NIF3 family GTP cyclohydrolase 1 type 2
VTKAVGQPLKTMEFGPATIRRVAVVSGGAAGEIDEAGLKGIDAYVTGEPTLAAYHLAQEHGVHGIFAGHYATERFGVKALGDLLAKRFGFDVDFVDFDIPY